MKQAHRASKLVKLRQALKKVEDLNWQHFTALYNITQLLARNDAMVIKYHGGIEAAEKNIIESIEQLVARARG